MKTMNSIGGFVAAMAMMIAGSAVATPFSYNVSITAVGHLRGQSVESATPTLWKNISGTDVELIFDPASTVTGATIALPSGATPFTKAVAQGETVSLSFDKTGLYRFALSFADGTVKAGELAVVKAEIVNVDIIGIAFSPKEVRIKAGQTVRWINTTTQVHTVTTDPALAANPVNAAVPAGALPFHSGNIESGASYTMKLVVPGTYKYFCKPHEAMGHVGTVIVE
jgi:plastocyanin